MNNPFVSICIPVYNSSSLCKQAIDSALNQKFEDYEIVIVDDASTDDTAQVIKQYEGRPRVRVYYNETNLGMTGNWNKCLQLARGKYISFAHHDDTLRDSFLVDLHQIISENENLGVIAFLNQSRVRRPIMGLIQSNDYFRYIFSMVNVPAPTEAVYIKLESLEYDKNLKYGPEMDIYLKIAKLGFNAFHSDIVNCDRNPSKWEGSVTSNSRFSFIRFSDCFYIIKKYKDDSLINYNLLKDTVFDISVQVYQRYARGIAFGVAEVTQLKYKFEDLMNKNNYYGLSNLDRIKLFIKLRFFFAAKFVTSLGARVLSRK
ncbi:glycosyltransferase family 2 protein [Sporocytophaga myxococcoides]|uniref:glycosyltransferase family 2 protein n=1 Tax=Sporocytophaga myxococcoides TaxID=153721 RepID=UPI0004072160|nr:glycosyltransferase family 2 protein [Sporocytophaga myxococcoides]